LEAYKNGTTNRKNGVIDKEDIPILLVIVLGLLLGRTIPPTDWKWYHPRIQNLTIFKQLTNNSEELEPTTAYTV
jgi:hypothetical protein